MQQGMNAGQLGPKNVSQCLEKGLVVTYKVKVAVSAQPYCPWEFVPFIHYLLRHPLLSKASAGFSVPLLSLQLPHAVLAGLCL